MSRHEDTPAARVARVLGTALAVAWAVLLLAVFGARLVHPLELEWMEGGTLEQALRFQQNLTVYGEPSADYVPFLYTPLYSIAVAVVGAILPLDFAVARIVSVVAVVACGAAIYVGVRREQKPVAHGLIAVGLYCSGYVLAFRWYDVARPDSMMLALCLWALVLLRDSWGDTRKAALAGLLMALAFWTKQTAAVFVIASGVAALWVAPKQLWVYAGVIALVDGGGVLLGSVRTDGWLWTWVYEMHQSHAFNAERFWHKTWAMYLHGAPFVCLAVLVWWGRFLLPFFGRGRRLDRVREEKLRARILAHRGDLYWAWLALAGALSGALGYATQWAEPNAFMPAVALCALFVGVALPDDGRVAEVVGVGLCLAQMCMSLALEPNYYVIKTKGWGALASSYRWQDPARTLPTPDAVGRASRRAIDLRSETRPVFALHRPWWNRMSGGAGHVGSMGLHDVPQDVRRELRAELVRRLDAGEYGAVWLEGEAPAWLAPVLERHFRLERRARGADRVLPVTGFMSEAGMELPYRRAQLEFRPLRAREPAPGWVLFDFEDGTLQGFSGGRSAFGSRPRGSVPGRQVPAVADQGGEFFLSSGSNGLKPTGTASSPWFESRPERGLRVRVAASRATAKVAVRIVGEHAEDPLLVPLPKKPYAFETFDLEIPAGWGAGRVRLIVEDRDPKAAVFVDDVSAW